MNYIKLYRLGDACDLNTNYYHVDTPADLASILLDKDVPSQGSIALVLTSGNYYVLSTSRNWVLQPTAWAGPGGSGGGGGGGGTPIWGQIAGDITDQVDLINYIDDNNRNFWFESENDRDTYFEGHAARLKEGVIAGCGEEDNYTLYQFGGGSWQKIVSSKGGALTFYFLTDDWAAITDFTPYLNSDVVLTDAPDPDPQPGGQGIWGQITGNLPDQTDLNNVLEDIYLSQRTVVVPMTTAAWEAANPQNYVGKQVVITDAPEPIPNDSIPAENIPEYEGTRPVVINVEAGAIENDKNLTINTIKVDTLTGLVDYSDPANYLKIKSNGLKFGFAQPNGELQLDTTYIYNTLSDIYIALNSINTYLKTISGYEPSSGDLPVYTEPNISIINTDLSYMANYNS